MDKFVIVDINNKQYKVSEGDVISIDRILGEPKSKIVFDQVLLAVDKKDVKIGKPSIDKAKVDCEIVEHYQGDKVTSSTYKAKARQRRKVGSRPQLTKIKINKII